MPDWSYQPLFKPALFSLAPNRARDLTLNALGTLAAYRLGPRIIELMGHMRTPEHLTQQRWGITFPGPVGVDSSIDPNGTALGALSRFGVGFVMVGPVTETPIPETLPIERQAHTRTLHFPEPLANRGCDTLINQLSHVRVNTMPIGIRLGHAPDAAPDAATDEQCRLIARLAPYATFFVVDYPTEAPARWRSRLERLRVACQQSQVDRPLLIGINANCALEDLEPIITPALALGISGVVISGGMRSGGQGMVHGAPAQEPALRLVQTIHRRWHTQVTTVVGGGILQPADATRLLDAGATFVMVASGLVFTGPGLPKRINEVLSYRATTPAPTSRPRHTAYGWLWFALLGCGMVVGGILAWLVASTRVVLPYDEAFVGLTRAQFDLINPRLLPFMAHDRVTLAGTMIAIGVLYFQLALFGVRKRVHWARRALVASATIGFASFFLFLGFGYFDPLHALVTVLLLPFFILGWRGHAHAAPEVPQPDLYNDRRWLAGMWGQLLFVGLGIGLTVAGMTIALVGITTVFVPDDLRFLQTTPERLAAANARLPALVAHDRAGFGGALVSNGIAVLLLALWGFRRGARWVWWTLLAAGVPGFLGSIGVHLWVSYLILPHIAPALVAALMYVVGLVLSYPFLAQHAMLGDRGMGTQQAQRLTRPHANT